MALFSPTRNTQSRIRCYTPRFIFPIEHSGDCSLCNPSCSYISVSESLRGLVLVVEAWLLSLELL